MSFGLASFLNLFIPVTTKMISQILIFTCTFKGNIFWKKNQKKKCYGHEYLKGMFNFLPAFFKSFVVPDNTF